MLDLPDYARKWALKKQWYADQGIASHEAGVGANGILLWTDDRGGADAQAWKNIARSVFGTIPPASLHGTGEPRGRRPARKVTPARRQSKP